MTTREQLDDFRAFALDQLEDSGEEFTLDELYSLWRSRHPTPAELIDSVDALNAAYQELKEGDEGAPAGQALRESCERLGLVIDG